MKIDYSGFAALCPHKKGTIKNSKSIGVIEFIKKPKRFHSDITTETKRGKILSKKISKNELVITAKFRKPSKKKILKEHLVRTIMSSIDFKKENLEKSFRKMLFFNFGEKDLERFKNNKCVFEIPKEFRNILEGERMYLKVRSKYYEL